VISALARLADPASIPQLNHDLSGELKLSPPEACVATLVDAHLSMRAILDMSPLREDDTLQLLANLVTKGVVTISTKGR
jgi:hypothetical protein